MMVNDKNNYGIDDSSNAINMAARHEMWINDLQKIQSIDLFPKRDLSGKQLEYRW